MSNLVFPLASLPGAYIDDRDAYDTIQVDEALAGNELRSTWSTYTRTRYTVKLNFARSASQYTEMQKVVGFFKRHRTQLDSFLLDDPEDDAVTDHGFGVGDGITAAFQLQRAHLAPYYDSLGQLVSQSSKPVTNALLYSQDFSNAAWAKSAGVTAQANAALAPDGTGTASRINYDGTGAQGIIHQIVSQAGNDEAVAISSVWLRADAPRTVNLFNDGDTKQISLTTDWQRFFIFADPGQGGDYGVGVATITAIPCVIYAWGAQSESGVYDRHVVPTAVNPLYAYPSAYIPTTSAALTRTPAFWPAAGDGMEPISDLKGAISVYVDNDWQSLIDAIDPAGFNVTRQKRQVYPWARTNLCFYSQAPTDASWTKTTLTDNGAVTAPDGSSNARKYTATAGGATLARTVAGLVAGNKYTASVWVRCVALTSVKLGTTEGSSASIGVGSSWRRLGWSFTAAGASTTLTLGAGGSWGNGVALEVFGFQLELGGTATGYITTTSAAVAATDFTLSGGVVTFSAAPLAGAVLSWTGGYYRRVRFLDASLPLQRIVRQLWSNEGIKLVTVK